MLSRLAVASGARRAALSVARAQARRTLFASAPLRSADAAAVALSKEDEESAATLSQSNTVVDKLVNALSLNTWKGFVPLSIVGLVSLGEMGWVSVDAELNIAFLMILFTSTVWDVAGPGFRRDTMDARLASLRDINRAEDMALSSLTNSRDAHRQVLTSYEAMKALQAETLRVAELQSELGVRRARHALRASIADQLRARVDAEARRASDLKAQIVSQTVAAVADYFASGDEEVALRLQRNGLTLACASMASEGEVVPMPVTDEELRDVSNVVDPVDLAYLSVLSHRAAAARIIMDDYPALVQDELPVVERLLQDLRADVATRLPEGATVDDIELLPPLVPAEVEDADDEVEVYEDEGDEVVQEEDREVDGYEYEEEEEGDDAGGDETGAADAGEGEEYYEEDDGGYEYSADYVDEYYDVDYDEEDGVEVARVIQLGEDAVDAAADADADAGAGAADATTTTTK